MLLNRNSRRALLVPALIFVLAAIAAGTLIWHADQHNRQEARARASNLAAEHAGHLQRSIEHGLSATYALAALVRQGNGNVPNFDEVAGQMLSFYPGVAELALVPGGVIRKVVPLAGNEKALGLDLLRDPAQKKEALLARNSGKLTLAGPLDLVQGGVGVVGRLPIFLDDTTEKPRFWGFTLVVIRIPEMLQTVDLPKLMEQGFGYELSRVHPDTGQKQIIAASSNAVLVEPVAHALSVPNATWTLSLSPVAGWGDSVAFAIEAALGLVFSLLLAYVAKLLLDLRVHKQGLEVLVDERTVEIRASEFRYRQLFEGNPQPMWVYDLETLQFLAVNNAAVAHYGYSRDEFLAMRITDIRTPDEAARLLQRVADVRKEDIRDAGLWQHVAKDGTLIEAEVTAHTLDFAGRRAQIVHANDVTEQVRAERKLRESEARFRAIAELSTDWYWEQDEQLRFVRPAVPMEGEQDVDPQTFFGTTRRETAGVVFDEPQLSELEAICAARQPYRDFEIGRRSFGGPKRYLKLSGEPIFDACGRFAGYRGIGKDITESKRDEQLLRLEHAVAARVAGADDTHSAMQEILRAICESEGWGFGLYWLVDAAAGVLRFKEYWSEPEAGLVRYAEETRKTVFAPGVGMVGHVWQSGKPLWVPDTAADARVVQQVLLETRLRSLFAFPLVASEKVTGVLAFLSREAREPDERLLASARMLGSQVGQFLQRRLVQDALHESEHVYRTMIDSAPEGVWMIGPDRLTTEVNPRMCELLGYAREDMLGRNPVEFADAENGRIFQKNAALVPNRQTRTYEVDLRHRDGQNIPTEFNATDLFNEDGSVMGVLAFVVDLTERRQHEVQLQSLNEELEQRVAERTQALEVANNELEAFSYSVSHDLRAPLRAIQGFSSLVETQYAGNIDEQGRDMLRRVGAGAQRMGMLIDDLLRLSRISRQTMRRGPVDLSALVWEVAGELQADAPERKVEWLIAPQVEAEGDPGLLRVALQNLIGNAWKYSSKREDARIEFGVEQQDEQRVYFVRDNGAGFDMAYANKLFGAFQRLHSTAEFPGTGIGLATVARILHRHGGTVRAEGVVGEGATFYFSLS